MLLTLQTPTVMNVDKNAAHLSAKLMTLKPMNNYHRPATSAGGVFEQASEQEHR